MEEIKDLLYDVYNEFSNEIDSINDIFGDNITDKEIDFAFILLSGYIDKVIAILKESEVFKQWKIN